jgi:hypothetical protein
LTIVIDSPAVVRIGLPASLHGVAELAVEHGRSFTAHRDSAGRFASSWRRVHARVTERGHWYRSDDEKDAFSNDTVCRGCGRTGHFDYILDYRPCTAPASAADVLNLLGKGAR